MDEAQSEYPTCAGSRLLHKKLPIVVISPPEEVTTKRILYSSWLRQLAITSVISIPTFAMSFVIASTSFFPAILNSNETADSLQESRDFAEAVSFPMLITIPSTLFGFWLSKYFGHRSLLRSSLLGYLVLFVFMAYQRTYISLVIVRTLLQFLNGICNSFCLSYISELMERKLRGTCEAINQLGLSCGMFNAYVLLTYMKPKYTFLFNSILFVFGLLGSNLIPESPMWLLRCDKTLKAQKSIADTIGENRGDKVCEMYQEVISDLEENEDMPSISQQVVLMKKSENWKSSLILVLMLALRELGGHSAVLLYAKQMFHHIGIESSVTFYPVLVGIVAVISSTLTTFLHNKVEMKKVIVGSEIFSVISLFVTGILTGFDFSNGPVISSFGLLSFTFFSIFGVGPVPFIFIRELAPCEVKVLSTLLAFFSYYLCNFIITYFLPMVLEIYAIGTILFSFATINIITAVILFFTFH